jgi:uncharacterized protein (TIGR03437 family)
MRVEYFVLTCSIAAAMAANARSDVCWVASDAEVPFELIAGINVPQCGALGAAGRVADIASGSIIAVVGEDLSPGTSVRLNVRGTSVDATIVSAEANRVRILVPPGTPHGEGTLTASRNGTAAGVYAIRVVDRRFRLYHRSPQAVAQNISARGEWRPNTFSDPARPGQVLVLWGTGLGGTRTDEIQAYIGLQRARVLYAGPSGCCPGVDQIVLETPAGIEGCTVPVSLPATEDDPDDVVGGGYVTVAVAQSGHCSDPHGLSDNARLVVEANGTLKIGRVSLGGEGWFAADGIVGQFYRARAIFVSPPGTCGLPRGYTPVNGNAYVHAGPELTFTGPAGDRAVPFAEDYNEEILGAVYALPFIARELPPGDYGLHNGAGGTDVGPFRLSIPIAESGFRWTNRETVTPVRGEDVTVTWSTPEDENGFVAISGLFLIIGPNEPNGFGLGGFSCLERASKGSFTVPSWLLWTPSKSPAKFLDVSVQYFSRREFTAPGLDFAEFIHNRHTENVRKPIE